jgi:predicted CxxxxCH...CXXCH cytochrome family protein
MLTLQSWGCSDPRSEPLINSDTGRHQALWASADVHGAKAKAAPSSVTGFAVCQDCHRTDFSGGNSGISCLNMTGCHGGSGNAPHPKTPWTSATRAHSDTDQGNAPVCAQCHAGGLNSSLTPSPPAAAGTAPGCYNSTLCHGNIGHEPGWADPTAHGATAKNAPSAISGFSYCLICHGSDFLGGAVQRSCMNTAGCHGADVAAPHSPKPWRGGARTHTNTDQGNAPVCAFCHTNGLNSSLTPTTPAAVGTAPGCFNSTLCHGTVAHAAGWSDPGAHGATAKGTPSGASGFSYCQTCHGDNFLGGTAQRSCLNTAGCHGAAVAAPHSPKPWRGATRTHTDTDTDNAPACAQCHTNGLNSSLAPNPPAAAGTAPGCFNSTLCHGTMGHAAGWSDPAAHGATAKGTPSGASGFSYCQTCHGTDFLGGTALRSCMNTAGCHGATVAAPHSPKPWRGGTRTHTDTDQSNASICAACHTAGLNSSVTPSTPAAPGTPPACFNNTLCHGNAGAPHVVPFTSADLHGPAAKQDLTYCQGCHADLSSGGAGSNPRFNVPVGSLVTGCEAASCHGASTAHPVPWKYAYTTSHQSAGNMAVACALCHGATLNGGVGSACSTCHIAGSPLTVKNCTSCHSSPTNGATAPNRAGSHAKHNALANVTGQCASCHDGGGSSTANHAYGRTSVFLSLATMYNAKTGGASYAANGTCSNVSCHGGQTTPVWSTGTIDVNTQCTSCHTSGTTQYNSYVGRHSKHSNKSCTDCHDTALLAVNHFTHLETIAMEGPASSTLRSQLRYNGTSCNPSAGGLTGCHGSENW